MLSLIAQKQGPPFHILWFTHFLRKVIPVASDIKICSRIRHYFPGCEGDASGQRLAPPLHGSLTPGRISVGRPPAFRRDWTGVSLSLTLSLRYTSRHSWLYGQMDPLTPYHWPSLIEAGRVSNRTKQKKVTSFASRAPTDGLRASSNVAAPYRAHQERIQNIGYKIFKVQMRGF